MAAPTKYRLAEEIQKLLQGGDIGAAAQPSLNEIKIAIGQAINTLLKTDYININLKMGEEIPNGTVVGWYEGIEINAWNGKSYSELPIKPIKLPKNMGVFAVYLKKDNNCWYDLDNELIPIDMGMSGMLRRQPLISTLLGQIGYSVYGTRIQYTQDITSLFPDATAAVRLIIMDIAEYGDYDTLPILPEHEFEVKRMVVEMYTKMPIPDKLSDPSVKEQKDIDIRQQRQS